MSKLPEAILEALKEVVSLWKSYIDTREAAYRRKMDKRSRRAIDIAEQYILHCRELMAEDKELSKLGKRFFKYNN